MKSDAKEVLRGLLIFLRLFVGYTVLFLLELMAVMFFPDHTGKLLIVSLIVNVAFIFQFMNYGFKKLRDDHKLERIFSLVYGIACYLCLIFQFAVLFYLYYMTVEGGGVIPKEVMGQLSALEHVSNDDAVLRTYIGPLFSHVLPGFYKFPSTTAIVPILQFYIGKFTDLFVLAYIVETIRKRTGLK